MSIDRRLLLLGLVGTDVISGASRYNVGISELADGISVAAVTMGLFGITVPAEFGGADMDCLAYAIVMEELRLASLYRQIQQAFAVLLPVQTVGVMGDGRTYEEVVAVRAVSTDDFMTADWYPLPYDVLQRISTRIINEVRGVNRVVYDISSKPPSTIEWE